MDNSEKITIYELRLTNSLQIFFIRNSSFVIRQSKKVFIKNQIESIE